MTIVKICNGIYRNTGGPRSKNSTGGRLRVIISEYPSRMESLTPEDVLELWETTWGPLDERWKDLFLTHKDMQEILKFNYRQIDFCIRKTRKLENLLKVLKQTPIIRVAQKGSSSGGTRHVSEYGKVTIKSPGKSEAMLPGRTECPSCGMVVTGNNVKCRCG